MYDAIIVGSGQAGMFAAYRLSQNNLKVLVVESGKNIVDRYCPRKTDGVCRKCDPCNIMSGLGGAGLYSDGTLNLRYDVGGNLTEFTTVEKSNDLIREVDEVYQSMGASNKMYGDDERALHDLEVRAASHGVKFVKIRQRHMGSENTPGIIEKFADKLIADGVEFRFNSKVVDLHIVENQVSGVILDGGEEISASDVILAPGRVGAEWADEIAKKQGIKTIFGPIDVGVRIEVPAVIMEDVVKVNHDPKFHIQTSLYDDFVRTFCTNHQGYVVEENYGEFIGVNGHSLLEKHSENSNFAFLVRVSLTEPVEDSISYGDSISHLATTIGGGKPIVQRLYDLRNGKRSHPNEIERNPVKASLVNTTSGDISMALPHRVVVNILEGLDKLNNVIPGVAEDSTLLYAPEIKYYSTRFVVDDNMQTSIKGLYAAGDGCGLSRDIVNACATGLLAAEGVLNNKQ